MRLRSCLAVGVSTLALGTSCASEVGNAETIDQRAPELEPIPEGEGIELVFPEITLAPGEEVMTCWVPDWVPDRDYMIRSFNGVQGPMGHHIVALVSVLPRTPGEVFDCTNLESMATFFPLILPDPEDHPLLPEGFALKLPAHAFLVLQSHYINYANEPIVTRDKARFHFAPEGADVVQASYLILNHAQFELKEGKSSLEMDCPVEHELNLINLFGHMHELGTRITVDLGKEGERRNLYKVKDWTVDFRDAPPVLEYIRLDQPQALRPGDNLHLTCDFDNDRGRPVRFPEEMCVVVAYYYPARPEGILICNGRQDGLTDLDYGVGDTGGRTECPDNLPAPSHPCLEGCGNRYAIGQPCTKGGQECNDNPWPGVFCSADFGDPELQFCTGPCSIDADCGPGAMCTGDPDDPDGPEGCFPLTCQ